jgi:hypothetical protein
LFLWRLWEWAQVQLPFLSADYFVELAVMAQIDEKAIGVDGQAVG